MSSLKDQGPNFKALHFYSRVSKGSNMQRSELGTTVKHKHDILKSDKIKIASFCENGCL